MSTDFSEQSMNLITGIELKHALNEIPNWKRYNDEGKVKLTRAFHFVDFKTAFLFAAKVTEISESQRHHPVLLIEWGKNNNNLLNHIFRICTLTILLWRRKLTF